MGIPVFEYFRQVEFNGLKRKRKRKYGNRRNKLSRKRFERKIINSHWNDEMIFLD